VALISTGWPLSMACGPQAQLQLGEGSRIAEVQRERQTALPCCFRRFNIGRTAERLTANPCSIYLTTYSYTFSWLPSLLSHSFAASTSSTLSLFSSPSL
jgi:hypothetical protein